jgi:hypothetical protein
MQIIYNPTNFQIFRLLPDDASYASSIPFSTAMFEAYTNQELITAINAAPHKFKYLPQTYQVEENLGITTKIWNINLKFWDEQQAVFLANFPSLEDTLSAIDTANDIEDLKEVMRTMVRGICSVARRSTG